MIRKYLFICILMLVASINALAQDEITVTGTVLDEQKLPMIGVSVSVQDMPGLGAITDVDGKFSIKMPPYNPFVCRMHSGEYLQTDSKSSKLISLYCTENKCAFCEYCG